MDSNLHKNQMNMLFVDYLITSRLIYYSELHVHHSTAWWILTSNKLQRQRIFIIITNMIWLKFVGTSIGPLIIYISHMRIPCAHKVWFNLIYAQSMRNLSLHEKYFQVNAHSSFRTKAHPSGRTKPHPSGRTKAHSNDTARTLHAGETDSSDILSESSGGSRVKRA